MKAPDRLAVAAGSALAAVLLLTAAVLVCLRDPVQAAGVGVPQAYNSGSYSELVSQLVVTHYPTQPYARTVVYCVDLGSTPAGGEILHVDADLEVTNDLGYNISLETHLLLAVSCTATDGGEVAEANGANVTPDMHHGVASRAGVYVVPAGNSRRYVTLVAWAASTRANQPPLPPSTVRVEQDYGRLAVLRWT